MVLLRELQFSCVLFLLCTQSKVDAEYGAYEPAPSSEPKHEARGCDGVYQTVVVGSVAATEDGRVYHSGIRLLLNYHDIGSGSAS